MFHDPHDTDGSNRTGIYSARMNLHQKIPEWLPLDGLRVRIQHPGMQKLCNGCFGSHLRKDCENEKVSWKDYVSSFRTRNPEIPESFYGKWGDLPSIPELRKPNEKDYCIPTNQSELDDLMNNMRKSGFDKEGVIKILKERKTKFDAAMEEYERERMKTNFNPECQ